MIRMQNIHQNCFAPQMVKQGAHSAKIGVLAKVFENHLKRINQISCEITINIRTFDH